MMFGKSGVMGEGVLMIYRLLLVSFIAFIVLGVSSVFYAHYIDVRDVEARIMAREVVNCLAPEGVLEVEDFEGVEILSYCGFESGEIERFFVRVVVEDFVGGEVLKLSQGDSGALWVRDAFGNAELVGEGVGRYDPGYFNWSFPVFINGIGRGEMKLEVLVSDEF